jgi:hypothetical protein
LDEQKDAGVKPTPAIARGKPKPPRINIADGLRLAVLALVAGLGLEAALGAPTGSWWVRLLAGLGTVVVTVGLLRWGRSRYRLMRVAGWVLPIE